MVSTHSRPKAAGGIYNIINELKEFQHTAARRRLAIHVLPRRLFSLVSTHSRPKAAGKQAFTKAFQSAVSTHSRPKAAGDDGIDIIWCRCVSTHSRPKAAGSDDLAKAESADVSTHSRPKAAGECVRTTSISSFGFNTQPPEGGWVKIGRAFCPIFMFQHTAARRRLDSPTGQQNQNQEFQHTAARRRLGEGGIWFQVWTRFQHTAARRRLAAWTDRTSHAFRVSTHSRPKAAGKPPTMQVFPLSRFNTQPPEGGWFNVPPMLFSI